MTANSRAVLWIISSCFLFSSMNALAKLLFATGTLGGLHPLQVTFARYVFAAAALLPFAFREARFPSKAMFVRYAVRVLGGYFGVVFMFLALEKMRLSDATAIGFTSPFFAIALAALLLGERPDRRRWLAAVIGFVGVLVITRPSGSTVEPAALFALLAAFAMGIEIVGVKWVSEVDKPTVVILLSNLLAVPLGAVAAAPVWIAPSASQWLLLVAIGVVAAVGQQCVLRGARLGEASFIAPFFYFSLVFATLLGAVIFNEVPPLSTLIGSAIIFVGVLLPAEPRLAPLLRGKLRE
ncbi:DMT family transporter [uncultured Bradyrhizobium sp.]|uniref:DMT family transporter n=1 Tax=uncultured Bradyrhizobium sp. TaxID=199684 RepID=UPI0035CCA763